MTNILKVVNSVAKRMLEQRLGVKLTDQQCDDFVKASMAAEHAEEVEAAIHLLVSEGYTVRK